MRRKDWACWAVSAGVFLSTGCGYTSRTLLPENVRAVHVAPIKNAIDLSSEIGDKTRYRVYRPGIEVELTDAVINRFVFDGHLKVSSLEEADAVVEAKVVEYRRDPLRYTDSDDVQEYRISVVADVVVYRRPGRRVIWREKNLIGESSFFLSGARAISEDEAAALAVKDLARRVVEQTLEVW